MEHRQGLDKSCPIEETRLIRKPFSGLSLLDVGILRGERMGHYEWFGQALKE